MTDAQPSESALGDLLSAALSKDPVEAPITGAAYGCPDALADLANGAYASAKVQSGMAALFCYIEALTFSRLLAAQGERDSATRVVFLLDEIGVQLLSLNERELSATYKGRGLLLAELMAEDGDDEMAAMVAAIASKLDEAVHLEAHRLRELIA